MANNSFRQDVTFKNMKNKELFSLSLGARL